MNKKLLFLFLSLCLLVTSAQAQYRLIDGVYYEIDYEAQTATVVGSQDENYPYTGAMVIPASVSWGNSEDKTKTAKVTAIGEGAFRYCDGLTSLTIPATITIIGESAFDGCTALEHVNIPAAIKTIEPYTFSGCTSLEHVDFPAKLATIGEGAFFGCAALKKVTIPASVKAVSGAAFEKCTALTELTIADGTEVLTLGNALAELPLVNLYVGRPLDFDDYNTSVLETVTIGPKVGIVPERFFYEATNLRSLTLSEGVRKIGEKAFFGCTALESVVLPEGIWKIEELVFSGCTALESVVLPASVDTLCWGAFERCSSLNSINLDNVKELDSGVFQGCTSLTDVTLPEGLQLVPDHLFSGCTSLKSVTLPSTIKSIEEGAFQRCPIVSMSLPDSVTRIAKDAFESSRAFNDFSFGTSVLHIEDGAFNYSKIKELRYRGTLADWLKIRFAGYQYPEDTNPVSNATTFMLYDAAQGDFSALTDIVIPEGTDSIPAYAFSCMGHIGSVEFPNSLKRVGQDAFYGCRLSTLVFHGALTEMERYTFSSCTTLRYEGTMEQWCSKEWHLLGCTYLYIDGALQKNVTIPESVLEIKDCTFYGCSGLVSVSIPAATKIVGAEAFKYCSNLKSVIWGGASYARGKQTAAALADGYRIGDYAFAYSQNLAEIVLPENIASVGSGAFTGTSWLDAQPDGPMYMDNIFVMYKGQVPANSHIVIREGTTVICSRAFSDYAEEGFTVALPSSFTTISEGAFGGCRGLKGISLPRGIVSIGESAFEGCSGLKGISLPRGLVSIGKSAFEGCNKLTEVDLPQGLESIGENAFAWTGLTSIRIPSTVKTFYTSSFSYCYSLGSMSLADGTDSLNIMAGWTDFAYGSPINSLYLGRNAKLVNEEDGLVHMLYLGYGKLKELIIGANVADMQYISCVECWNLSDITVLRQTPPVISYPAIDYGVFGYGTLENATLHVPAGAESAYAVAEVWKDFLHITGEDLTGIGQVVADTPAQSAKRHYNVSGHRVKAGTPGIHVVRSNDGTTRKILVK